MSAVQIFLVACGIFILGRWANNETTLSVKIAASIIFGCIFFAILDDTPAEDFSKMLAWLIFTVAILDAVALKGIANAIAGATGTESGTGGTLVSGTSPSFNIDIPPPPSTGSTA